MMLMCTVMLQIWLPNHDFDTLMLRPKPPAARRNRKCPWELEAAPGHNPFMPRPNNWPAKWLVSCWPVTNHGYGYCVKAPVGYGNYGFTHFQQWNHCNIWDITEFTWVYRVLGSSGLALKRSKKTQTWRLPPKLSKSLSLVSARSFCCFLMGSDWKQ